MSIYINTIIAIFILLPSVIFGQVECNNSYTILRQSQLDSLPILNPDCIALDDIRIYGNDITNLSALENIRKINNLIIRNTKIISLDDLKNMDTIKNFNFGRNHYIKTIDFKNKIQITNDLIISGCDSLTAIVNNPFYSLSLLTIHDNMSLTNVINLNITQCNSVLLSGSALEDLSISPKTECRYLNILRTKTLNGIQYYETPDIEIANSQLININELDNIKTLNHVELTNNLYLSDCSIPLICSNLDNPNFTLSLLFNATGCNTKEEIRQKCLSATNNTEAMLSFRLYPNPALHQVFIDGLTEEATIDIYDIQGKVVRSTIAYFNTPIDLSDFNSGAYIVSIKTTSKTEMHKLIIY
ncbi:MAG: T9SS type A sorting domain-containing protein [Chitinophagales bacterium]|nr:T9SS type A sorting domain-containing protein [Chitinophagales bacterium]